MGRVGVVMVRDALSVVPWWLRDAEPVPRRGRARRMSCGRRAGSGLLLEPRVEVVRPVPQVTTDPVSGWPAAGLSPAVDRPDRDLEEVSDFLHCQQGGACSDRARRTVEG